MPSCREIQRSSEAEDSVSRTLSRGARAASWSVGVGLAYLPADRRHNTVIYYSPTILSSPVRRTTGALTQSI